MAVAPRQAARPSVTAASADVIGDVAFELLGRQTEVAILGRQRIRGMVAEDQQPAPGLASHRLK